MSESFQLHPQLARDSIPVAVWPLSAIRLMNDARFPWLLLIPQRSGLRDFHDPDADDYRVLSDEIRRASELLNKETGAQKINVASLGNMVPQLHIHIIARFEKDAAWPGPVWGVGTAEAYADDHRAIIVRRYKEIFAERV